VNRSGADQRHRLRRPSASARKRGSSVDPHSRHQFEAFEIIAADQHAAFAAVIAFENFSEFG
jgi:hypothetical protein